MLQLNTLVRFIHSHSPARLSKFKKILARRPKSVPTPALAVSKIFFDQNVSLHTLDDNLRSKVLPTSFIGRRKLFTKYNYQSLQ